MEHGTHAGCHKGHLEWPTLLDKGADINARNKDGDTALMTATDQGTPGGQQNYF